MIDKKQELLILEDLESLAKCPAILLKTIVHKDNCDHTSANPCDCKPTKTNCNNKVCICEGKRTTFTLQAY